MVCRNIEKELESAKATMQRTMDLISQRSTDLKDFRSRFVFSCHLMR